MKRRNIKAPIKKEKKASVKRKIIVTVILLGTAFSGAFLIYYILQVALNTNTPMVVVVSGSMEPNLHKGDLLFLKGTNPENIRNGTIDGKEGDIIVFDARGLPGWSYAPVEPVVHRVIDKKYDNGWLFLTKGDANIHPDPAWISEARIYGVVVSRIPYIGWVKIILTDSGLLVPLLVIVSILLVASIIWDLVKKDDDKEKDNGKNQIYYEEKIKDENKFDFTQTKN
ncbi:MAG: signal peptidase I [Promethearchaeota archaeon]